MSRRQAEVSGYPGAVPGARRRRSTRTTRSQGGPRRTPSPPPALRSRHRGPDRVHVGNVRRVPGSRGPPVNEKLECRCCPGARRTPLASATGASAPCPRCHGHRRPSASRAPLAHGAPSRPAVSCGRSPGHGIRSSGRRRERAQPPARAGASLRALRPAGWGSGHRCGPPRTPPQGPVPRREAPARPPTRGSPPGSPRAAASSPAHRRRPSARGRAHPRRTGRCRSAGHRCSCRSRACP